MSQEYSGTYDDIEMGQIRIVKGIFLSARFTQSVFVAAAETDISRPPYTGVFQFQCEGFRARPSERCRSV